MLIKELDLTSAKVIVIGDGGSAPTSVVEETKEQLAQDDDYEQVYCVFDRDGHERYKKAVKNTNDIGKKRAFKQKAIMAIASVPCFELWYLLHVPDARTPCGKAGSPCKALTSEPMKHSLFEPL